MALFVRYLLIETVNASEELAQGQMASGFNPLLWNKFRNASQEVKDPEWKEKEYSKPPKNVLDFIN